MANELAGLHFLVVEDQAVIAASISSTLREAGGSVMGPVGTIQDALDHIASEAIDAAVLDLKLYDEWVDPVADALLKLQVPVVLLTGYERSDLPARFLSFMYLQKPWHPDQLVEAIRRAMSTARTPVE